MLGLRHYSSTMRLPRTQLLTPLVAALAGPTIAHHLAHAAAAPAAPQTLPSGFLGMEWCEGRTLCLPPCGDRAILPFARFARRRSFGSLRSLRMTEGWSPAPAHSHSHTHTRTHTCTRTRPRAWSLPFCRRKALSCAQNAPKTRAKTCIRALLDALSRNSLQTSPLHREILCSHSLLRCAILVNMSRKIAKFQATIQGVNGRFQANI
jgi:hypothetical protein